MTDAGFDPGGVMSTPGSDVYRATDRLVGALVASDASASVMRSALQAMAAARLLLAVGDASGKSLLERSEVAVDVLGRGIANLQYALNLTEEEPD